MTMAKAIKKFCFQCAGSKREVRNCEDPGCFLFPYRFGTNPARRGIGGRKRDNFSQKHKLELGFSTKKQEKIPSEWLDKGVRLRGRFKVV